MRDDAARIEWSRTKEYCMVCGVHWTQADFRGLQVHHIANGAGRSDEPCNWLKVCGTCHDRLHRLIRPALSIADALRAKRLKDPESYDFARVMALKGWAYESESELPN